MATTLQKESDKRIELVVEKQVRIELEEAVALQKTCLAEQGIRIKTLEERVSILTRQVEQKDKDLIEAALMVKKAREPQLVVERNLRLRTKQLQQSQQQAPASTTPGTSSHPSQS